MASEDVAVWNSFIQSLDVDPDKAKGIEQLPEDQKRHLIQSYVRYLPLKLTATFRPLKPPNIQLIIM